MLAGSAAARFSRGTCFRIAIGAALVVRNADAAALLEARIADALTTGAGGVGRADDATRSAVLRIGVRPLTRPIAAGLALRTASDVIGAALIVRNAGVPTRLEALVADTLPTRAARVGRADLAAAAAIPRVRLRIDAGRAAA